MLRFLLTGLLVLGLAGCSAEDNRPNIILLTLDTTRADRLGCYGHGGGASPILDRLGAQGVVFMEARSQVPITMPSHTSILTGTYPLVHGVHQHTDRFEDPEILTMAEILKGQGYRTAAFIGARVLDARFGLDRGFDVYADRIEQGRDQRPADSRRAAQVIADARDWFSRRPAGPYFSWLHFYDPHLVYDAPEPYRQRFAEDPYLAEIAYMDAQIGDFLAWLETRGELENTMVVALADHGESLGEHGVFGHTEYVYQEVLEIPFLISWPGRIDAGLKVEELVRSIDLLPTILDYLELDLPPQVQGISARALIEDRSDERGGDEPRSSYFESRYLEHVFGWAPLAGVESRGNKYIRAPAPELYALADDPGENRNLYQATDPLSRGMTRLLDDVVAAAAARDQDAATGSVDPQMRRALESLGYASPKSRPTRTDVMGEDPKDHIEAVRLYQQVMRGPSQRSTAADLEMMTRLANLEPDQPGIQMLFGDFLQHFGRQAAAEKAYRRAAELQPADPSPHLKLFALARRGGDDDQARVHLFAAQRADSLDAGVLFELAGQEARDRRFDSAERFYRRSLELRPGSVLTMGHLAALLVYLDRPQEALPILQESLTLPEQDRQELAFRHFLLGRILYADPARWSAAVDHLEQALVLDPPIKGPHRYLALILSEQGDARQAAVHARECLARHPESSDMIKMKTITGNTR